MVTDAEANAVGAVANTTAQAIEVARGLGGYVKDVLGQIPSDLLGIAVGDWVSQQRQRNLARMQAKTRRILEDIDPSRITEPSASVVLPLLRAAADEGREELQALWAALLANSMIDEGKRVRRTFFDAVAKMEPVDARVLDILGRHPACPGGNGAAIEVSLLDAGIARLEATISLDSLSKLGICNGQLPFDSKSIANIIISPFGAGLFQACGVA